MVSTVQDPDIFELSSLLNSFESDLSISYLHSRPKFEENLSKQIEHALTEIIHRESDLRASIGISKILLTSYSSLKQKNETLTIETKELTSKIDTLVEELSKSKSYEEKYFEVLSLLEETEKELNLANLKARQYSREHSPRTTNMSFDCISMDRFSAELADMSNQFREDYDKALKAKIQAEKHCAELEQRLRRKSEKLSAIKIEKSKHLRVSTDIDSFHMSSVSRPSLKVQSESGKSDLEEVENEMFRCESYRISFSRSWEVCRQEGVGVKGESQRRFTEEIYFCMTLSVVKLNNEHLSGVNVDYHDLYESAVKQNIPLHKWSYWIESQLSLVCLKSGMKVEIGKIKKK